MSRKRNLEPSDGWHGRVAEEAFDWATMSDHECALIRDSVRRRVDDEARQLPRGVAINVLKEITAQLIAETRPRNPARRCHDHGRELLELVTDHIARGPAVIEHFDHERAAS